MARREFWLLAIVVKSQIFNPSLIFRLGMIYVPEGLFAEHLANLFLANVLSGMVWYTSLHR